MQRALGLGTCPLGRLDIVAVGLVDGNTTSAISITPRLIPCNSSPAPASRDEQEKVNQFAYSGLRLADTDRLDKDVPVACSFAQQDCFTRILRHTAMRAARRRRTNKGAVAGRKKCHTGFVAEDAASAELAAGIYRKHRNLLVRVP